MPQHLTSTQRAAVERARRALAAQVTTTQLPDEERAIPAIALIGGALAAANMLRPAVSAMIEAHRHGKEIHGANGKIIGNESAGGGGASSSGGGGSGRSGGGGKLASFSERWHSRLSALADRLSGKTAREARNHELARTVIQKHIEHLKAETGLSKKEAKARDLMVQALQHSLDTDAKAAPPPSGKSSGAKRVTLPDTIQRLCSPEEQRSIQAYTELFLGDWEAQDEETITRAVWSTAYVNSLPNSSFAAIDANGERHLPYKDAQGNVDLPHLRNALARLDQTQISPDLKAKARKRLEAAARENGVGDHEPSPSEGERMSQPITRAGEADAQLVQMPLSILRIDEANRLVTLRATSEDVDSFKTAFAYEASKDAFQRWERIGNIREMHAPRAVGSAVKVDYLDNERAIDVTLRVSRGAQDTWEKVKDGTLKGGSIGASNVLWETNYQRSDTTGPEKIAKKYDLVELSLVDNPSNPACRIMAVRSQQPDMSILDYQEDAAAADPPQPKGILAPIGTAGVVNPAIANAMADAYGDLAPAVTRAQEPDLYTVGPQGVNLPPPTLSPAQPSVPDIGLPTFEPLESITQTRWRQAEAAAVRADRGRAVSMAGEQAVAAANIPQPQPGHTFDEYVLRVAAIRNSAEIAAGQTWDAAHPQYAPRPVSAPVIAQPQETRHTDTTLATDFHPAATPADLPDTSVPEAMDDHGGHEELGEDAIEQEHVHADGTKHTHMVRVRKGEKRAAVSEHPHTYIGGKPLDAALLTADFLRGEPWQIDAIHEQDTILKANPPSKAAQTSMSTVKPQIMGHPIMYNTEDAEALGFAVPEAASPVRPTPRDDITIDPAQFHQGGHKPDYDASAGPMDDDGDYDHDEDEREAKNGPPQKSPKLPAFTEVEPHGMPTPMERLQEAAEQRVGARISADSQDAIHSARESQMDAIKGMCEHCGCPECKVIVLALSNPSAYADMDEDDNDEDEDEDMGDDGEERALRAETLRIVQAQTDAMSTLVNSVIGVLGDLVSSIDEANREQRSALGDVQLTLADQQRGMAAQVTRAMHDQGQHNAALLQAMSQQLNAVASQGGELQATVAQIAAQERLVANAPVVRAQYPMEPRFAPPGAYNPYGSVPEEMLGEIQRRAAHLSPQEQAEVAAKFIRPAGR